MKPLILLLSLAVAVPLTSPPASITDPNQLEWIKGKFKRDTAASIEKLKQLSINSDPEPDLTAGFTSLYQGDGDLSGWTVLGGHHTFKASGGCYQVQLGLSWVEVRTAAVEVDRGFEVLAVSVATDATLD